jgi:hypothetical protein
MAAERKKGSSGRGSKAAGRSGGTGAGRSTTGASGSRSASSGRGSSSGRGGGSRRGGLGDDQGTRVGSPDAGVRNAAGSRGSYRGPSTQPVKEGLEGSILEGTSGPGDGQGKGRSTGAGAEASEGIHGASSRRGESSRTSATNARSGSRETSSSSTRPTKDRSASEPMQGSEQQHVSGYGGAGGAPKTSADQREPARKGEQPLGGSRKRGSRAQGQLGDEEAGDGL